MREDKYTKAARDEAPQTRSGWSPSLGQLLGLALSSIIIILVIVLGFTTGIGLIFAIPLVLFALIVPLLLFRGPFTPNKIQSLCPYCGSQIKIPDHIPELDCPGCNKHLEVRDRKLYPAR